VVRVNWTEIGERWPDAVVMWDRDVAPTLDWEPVFRERDGVLWADCIRDHWHLARKRRDLLLAQDILPDEPRRPCRCRVWDGEAWLSHRAWDSVQTANQLTGPSWSSDAEWQRQYMARPFPTTRPSLRYRVLDRVMALMDRTTDELADHAMLFTELQQLGGERDATDREVDRIARRVAANILRREDRDVPRYFRPEWW
jgi:hypothetical protein